MSVLEQVRQFSRAPSKRQQQRATRSPKVDAKRLAAALSEALEGEVRFDRGSRALYALDGSNYRQVPVGVVVPKTLDDVIRTVALCREFDAPLLSRGGGTSLAGQCCNVAVVMDWSKYVNDVLEIDAERGRARVRPGIVLDHLRARTTKMGWTFWPDPATHDHCTLGGMIGNNSCGVHAQVAGRTADNVESLEVLTYDGLRLRVGPTSDAELYALIQAGGRRGELYRGMRELRDRYADLIRKRYPDIPRRVSGYNLDELLPEKGFNVARALVGSEGTLVTVLEAELRLHRAPKARSLLLLGYKDIFHAADDVVRINEFGPIGLEAVDKLLVKYEQEKGMHPDALKNLPDGDGWLLVEFGGESKAETDARAQELMAALRGRPGAPSMKLFDDAQEEHQIWQIRESGLGATARVPGRGETWPGWEDSAVPPAKMGEYLRDFQKLLERYDYEAALYGHFGQGCLHCRITFDLKTRPGVVKFKGFMNDAADLVVKYGGSLSGEHGDGQSRAELLPKMYGEELMRAMREFKALWDPRWRMNPGKVVEPYRIDENMRLGSGYHPWEPKTKFSFHQDKFSFVNATERCVGVGKCRRTEGGTMCPSYMVTREELHSTRGRAHLLHEMLVGDPVQKGWKSEAVKEGLDLCLACKGCKSDCPVNVDMATYKAEFLSHYYQGKVRPRQAYAFGLIMYWARLGSLAPGLVNLVTHTPGLRALAKRAAGMPQERKVPMFASPSFVQRARERTPRAQGGPRVVLYPDTFNNFFHADTAMAALDVLERAGFDVTVPQVPTCCGRPLYDYGMLDHARKLLGRVLDTFREEIRAGVPFVVLEPSCASVFRDEMPNLFPHDLDAARFKQLVFTLPEFLKKKDVKLPRLERKAVVHGHCHDKSVLGFKQAEPQLLGKMGLEVEVPETGCCGMAGSFGFEKDKYAVSQAVGERVLLPKVRESGDETLIVADGFSCKTMIEQNTNRRALHTAQVAQMAMLQGPHGPAGPRPETQYVDNGGAKAMRRAQVGVALTAAGAVALKLGVGALQQSRRRRRSGWARLLGR